MDENEKTTSFMATLPGGAQLKLSTKSMTVLIGMAITAALVFNGIVTWELRVQMDILSMRVAEMARGIREQTCLQYLTPDERKANIGQAAACKKMGEMQ